MTFIQIQENIAKRFSANKKLFFNTANRSLYYNKTDLLPFQKRNLQKLKNLLYDMADDYHNNNDIERRVKEAIQKKGGGSKTVKKVYVKKYKHGRGKTLKKR
jgi:hypothetical protein